CYASCLILIASAHFAGRLRQRANPPLQPSLHERKSQVKPATNVCIQQNFASPCSAEDEFPTSSNLFPAAFAAGDNPIQSDLSSSCRAGNVHFQFVPGYQLTGL
ncbi:MAG: hypothetical protein WBV33_16505, partial [Terracidiphilus sp.]